MLDSHSLSTPYQHALQDLEPKENEEPNQMTAKSLEELKKKGL